MLRPALRLPRQCLTSVRGRRACRAHVESKSRGEQLLRRARRFDCAQQPRDGQQVVFGCAEERRYTALHCGRLLSLGREVWGGVALITFVHIEVSLEVYGLAVM